MSTAKVYPSESIQEQTIKVSVCDAYSPKLWVIQCNFFKLDDGKTFDKASDDLEQGLSRTLTEFPGLAGTTGRASKDPRDLVINLGQDAHVNLEYEDLSENADIPPFETLEEQSFPMAGLIAPLCPLLTQTPVSEGSPMITIKLNKLQGGLAMAIGFNHLLADFSTLIDVERVWSLHTADASAGKPLAQYADTVNDEACRKRLSTATSTASFEDPHWKVFPTTLSQLHLPAEQVKTEAALTMLQKAKNEHLAATKADQTAVTKWCIYHFSKESLTKLKIAASNPDSGSWISTMDALVGLFWSRLSVAKQSPKNESERSEVMFPINIRQRLQPPLPAKYHGNCVDIITAECSLTDLENPGPHGLQAAAKSVRKAVTGWSQAHWEAWLSMACNLPNDEAICPNPLMLLKTHNMGFNDYSNSSAHTLNWGDSVGRASRVRYPKPPGSMSGCATAVVVLPRLADGSLEVCITAVDELRQTLEADEVFAQYTKLQCAYA